MYAYKMEAQITSNHRVSIELPADFPEGGAEVIVLAKSAPQVPTNNEEPMNELLDWLETLPSTGRTKEDVLAQIAEERNSWGD